MPGHDSRDFEFARRFSLDVKRVAAPTTLFHTHFHPQVPGHDSRDFEFARRFGLDVRRVVAPASTSGGGGGGEDSSGDEGLPLTEPGVAVGSSGGGMKIDGLPTAEAKAKVRACVCGGGLHLPSCTHAHTSARTAKPDTHHHPSPHRPSSGSRRAARAAAR